MCGVIQIALHVTDSTIIGIAKSQGTPANESDEFSKSDVVSFLSATPSPRPSSSTGRLVSLKPPVFLGNGHLRPKKAALESLSRHLFSLPSICRLLHSAIPV